MEQHKAHREEKENAHRAAGNLLISANYFGGLERFCVSISEIKDGGGYVFLPSKTNRDGDNRSLGITNPGGAVLNLQSPD